MRNIRDLLAALRLARSLHPQLRASQLELLLLVYLKPGMSQSELAMEADLTLSAVSRAVDVLGTTGRRDKKSGAKLDWIETRRNPDDDRILQVFITPKGRNFVQTLEHLTYGSPIPQ